MKIQNISNTWRNILWQTAWNKLINMLTGYPKLHLIFFQIFHVQTLFLMFSFENLRGKLARGLAKIEPFANAWFDDWQQTMHTARVAGNEAHKKLYP